MGAFDVLSTGGVVVLLVVGAAIDLRIRRIPNWLTLGGAMLGLIVNVSRYQGSGAVLSISGWLVGVGLLAIPFILGGMGAGDVKFLGAVGSWGGPLLAVSTLLVGAIAGAVMAVGYLAVRGRLGDTLRPVVVWIRCQVALVFGPLVPALATVPAVGATGGPGRRSRLRIPYGPALAVGGVVALFLR